MAGRKTHAELERHRLRRHVRLVVRAWANDEVEKLLNRIENDILEDFDRRLAAGEPYKLDTPALMARIEREASEPTL